MIQKLIFEIFHTWLYNIIIIANTRTHYIQLLWLMFVIFVALEKEFYKHEETLFPVPPADTFDAVQHTDTKGIQGYQNSCYLDATLYGMFTFSNAFDILILEDVTTNAEELNLQKRLKYEIVYPLRKYVYSYVG